MKNGKNMIILINTTDNRNEVRDNSMRETVFHAPENT